MSASLAGRTALVTGATGGIGLETACALAARGATVIVGSRNAARGREVVERISREGGRAELLPIDLASFDSIREAADRFGKTHSRLDGLVHNAGVALARRRLSPDGHEVTWATNFLGAFLLTRLLLPSLKSAPAPRVVHVSSEAHRSGRLDWNDLELERGFSGYRAYANTKLALLLFARELARREPALTSNAVHPGVIATGIWRAVPPPFRWILAAVLPSAKKGARPVVRLAADEDVVGLTGRYFDKLEEARPSDEARDDRAAARLWELAERQTASVVR